MRGILLVALGAALIWLGLGRGGSSSAAGPDEGLGARTEALDGAPVGSAEVAPPPAEPVRVEEGPAAEPPTRGDEVREPAPSVKAPVAEVAAPESGSAERPTPPASAPEAKRSLETDLGFGGTARAATRGDATAPAPAPERLARLLVECWVAEAPASLEEYIQSGEGANLPVGRRQLVASFWQACMGETERATAQLARLESEDGVTSEQVALLRAAVGEVGSRALPASASVRDPLARAMRMVLSDDEARAALERQDHARAAEAYSELVHLELGAPWPPQTAALERWGEALFRAQSRHRLSPQGKWAAVEYVVKPNDNLIAIRKRVVAANDKLLLCTGLMAEVNDLRDARITPGETLRFPTDVPNVLVDLDARVTVFRLGSEAVRLWTVGIGREGHDTPIGTYEVGEKLENPPHMPEGGPALPFGHPDNPLGTRWIAWNKADKNTSIGFHGTSDPAGVGGRVSLGCIRMRNEDVEELFELLPRGARIIVQP